MWAGLRRLLLPLYGREGWRVEVVIANPSSTAFSGFIRDYIAPGKAIFSFGARAVSELGLPKLEIGE